VCALWWGLSCVCMCVCTMAGVVLCVHCAGGCRVCAPWWGLSCVGVHCGGGCVCAPQQGLCVCAPWQELCMWWGLCVCTIAGVPLWQRNLVCTHPNQGFVCVHAMHVDLTLRNFAQKLQGGQAAAGLPAGRGSTEQSVALGEDEALLRAEWGQGGVWVCRRPWEQEYAGRPCDLVVKDMHYTPFVISLPRTESAFVRVPTRHRHLHSIDHCCWRGGRDPRKLRNWGKRDVGGT
jgi:hypothetical protein